MAHAPTAKLIEALRGWSVTEIAEKAGVTRGAAEQWRRVDAHPNPTARRRLVEAAKRQADMLHRLATEVEREATAAASQAR